MRCCIRLREFLAQQFAESNEAPQMLQRLLNDFASAATCISDHVRQIGLHDHAYKTGEKNIHNDVVNNLDLLANDEILRCLKSGGNCAGALTEESEHFIPFSESAQNGSNYLCLFDPLDGSSNIHVGITIGTIFSVLPIAGTASKDISTTDFFQTGVSQVAAGYILYGSSTIFVYAAMGEVNGFTLDPVSNEFYLTHPSITTPCDGNIFSFNYAYLPHCTEDVKSCLEIFCQNSNLQNPERILTYRYIGSLASDFHRNLLEGGIFISPSTNNYPTGKLRLLYECFPLAFIIETAGGTATDGVQRILDICPHKLHQRSPLFIGSKVLMDQVHSGLNKII